MGLGGAKRATKGPKARKRGSAHMQNPLKRRRQRPPKPRMAAARMLFLDQNRAIGVAQHGVADRAEHAGHGVQATTAHDDQVALVVGRVIEDRLAGLALPHAYSFKSRFIS